MINLRLLFAFVVILHLAACATDSMGNAKYRATVARAHEDRMLALRECEKYAGDTKAMCRTEANTTRTKAVARAKAENLGTAEALMQAERDNVDADWNLAREKCNIYGGETRNECIAKARNARDAAYAEIDANEDKLHAQWKAAVAACMEKGGTYRSTCLAEASAKYGR